MRTETFRTMMRAAFIGALLLAFLIALLPTPSTPTLIDEQDKVGHFAAFLALALLGLIAWPARPVTIVVAMLLYGGAMELAQSLTTYRQGDPWDWLADALGVGAAVVIHLIWQKLQIRSDGPARAKAAHPGPQPPAPP
jgi:VanZ family protein